MATVSDTSNIPSKYECVMCKNWLNTPYLTECCGQQFCKSCLEGPTKTAPEYCPCCETGDQTFKYIMYKPLKDEIDNLIVFCPCKGNGCDKVIRRADRASHELECQYLVIDCKKCRAHVLRKDLPSHTRNRCTQREVVCLHCQEKGTYSEISGKHQEFCPETTVECDKMCGTNFKRKDSEKHKRKCPEEEYTCPFYEAGCTMTLKKRDLDKHLITDTQKHLSLLMAAYLSVKQELHELKNDRWEKF